jgi:hypothetical protein
MLANGYKTNKKTLTIKKKNTFIYFCLFYLEMTLILAIHFTNQLKYLKSNIKAKSIILS